MNDKVAFSVFTKPWETQSIDELAALIKGLGFDGIEFPLRAGYQVEPERAEKELPLLAEKLNSYGLKIFSVASSTDENIFAACAEAGVPVIRIMANIDLKEGYWKSEYKLKEDIEKFLPLCEKYNIKVGIQHHYGPMVSNSMELYHLVDGFDPKYIGAIWDSAHSALAGEEPELGLDILESHLCMVNLKNAFYTRVNGPESYTAKWDRYFTTAPNGLSSWPRIAGYLKQKEYNGVICLTAEYTDESQVDRYIAQDISYGRSLFQ